MSHIGHQVEAATTLFGFWQFCFGRKSPGKGAGHNTQGKHNGLFTLALMT